MWGVVEGLIDDCDGDVVSDECVVDVISLYFDNGFERFVGIEECGWDRENG